MTPLVNISTAKQPILRVALVESDPLRLRGFFALSESEPDFELIPTSLPEVGSQPDIDVVIIGDRLGQNLFDAISQLKRERPDLSIIVTGPNVSDQIVLDAIMCGANGYVFDGVVLSEFARALRVVSQGFLWAPRRVLSIFIERAIPQWKRIPFENRDVLSDRDKRILRLLRSGLSDMEISASLGVGVGTVKAHISRMMRRLGVHNRIKLLACTVAHSVVSLPANLWRTDACR